MHGDGAVAASDDIIERATVHAVDRLKRAGTTRSVATGEVLFREGETGNSVYLVEVGQVRLTIATAGRELAVANAWPGEIIGAVDALADRPRAATATATRMGLVVVIPGPTLDELVYRDRVVRKLLMCQLGDELKDARSQLASHCTQPTVVRVAGRLVALGDRQHDRTPTVRTTQSDMSQWVGATRESTARALAELRQSGCVTTGRGWIRIDDLDGLRRLAAH